MLLLTLTMLLCLNAGAQASARCDLPAKRGCCRRDVEPGPSLLLGTMPLPPPPFVPARLLTLCAVGTTAARLRLEQALCSIFLPPFPPFSSPLVSPRHPASIFAIISQHNCRRKMLKCVCDGKLWTNKAKHFSESPISHPGLRIATRRSCQRSTGDCLLGRRRPAEQTTCDP